MMELKADGVIVGAGFLTGGSLAIRGGFKAARNSAIGCAILLAVIEGVGIGIQRVMAENTRLDVRILCPPLFFNVSVLTRGKGTSAPARRRSATSRSGLTESDGCMMGFAICCSEDTPLCHIWHLSKMFGISEDSSALVMEHLG